MFSARTALVILQVLEFLHRSALLIIKISLRGYSLQCNGASTRNLIITIIIIIIIIITIVIIIVINIIIIRVLQAMC